MISSSPTACLSGSPTLDLFYQNLGESGFLKLTNKVASEPRYGRGVTWGDYDSDGRIDLFVANAALSGVQRFNRLYRNLGEGVFQPVTGPGPGGGGRNLIFGSWADYDNDGDLDLFVANGGWEQVRTNFLYRNNGDGMFTKIPDGDIASDQYGSVYGAWGDYDNDGFLDLFVSHSSPARPSPGYEPTVKNSLYHNNGEGTFTKITSGSLVSDLGCSLGCAWGDYDNDGFLDFFVTNFGSRVNDLFHNNGNTNSWIVVKCVGTVSNRSAVGAKVRVEGDDSRTDYLANAGDFRRRWLGPPERSARTFRPRRRHQYRHHPHRVAVRHRAGVAQRRGQPIPHRDRAGRRAAIGRIAENGQVQLTLTGKQGSRYAIETSIDLANWVSPLNLTVTVTNPSGTVTFPAPGAASDTRRFYRAALK